MYTFRSVLLIISSVSALVLNPALLLITPSSSSSSSSTNRSHVSISDTVKGPWNTSSVLEIPPFPRNLTRLSTPGVARSLEWKCDDALGVGPYAASCEEAARYMSFTPPGSDDSQIFTWGSRQWPADWDVRLRQEVVSSDGHCRINVQTDQIHPWFFARASQSQVRAGVSAVIENCMRNQARPLGGAATNISDDGLLTVSVRTLAGDEAFAGKCYGRMRPNAEAACRWNLERMYPDRQDELVFRPRSDPRAGMRTPYVIQSPDGRCAITIKTAGPPDTTGWAELFEVAVGLAGICARHGMQGRQTRLGDNGYLAMFLTDPSADDVALS